MKIHLILHKVIPFIGIVMANTILIFFNGKVNVRTGEWAFWPLSYINALTAIWIYYSIAAFICKKTRWLVKILCCIGESSIVFVCTNHTVIRISRKFLEIMQRLHFSHGYIWQEIVVFIISITGMIWLSKVFSKTRLNFFLGK